MTSIFNRLFNKFVFEETTSKSILTEDFGHFPPYPLKCDSVVENKVKVLGKNTITGRFQILKITLKILKSMFNTENKDFLINSCRDHLAEGFDKDYPGFRDKVDSDNKSFLVCILYKFVFEQAFSDFRVKVDGYVKNSFVKKLLYFLYYSLYKIVFFLTMLLASPLFLCVFVFIACKFVSKIFGKFFSPNYKPDAAGFFIREKMDGFDSIFVSKERYKSIRLLLLAHENIHVLQMNKEKHVPHFDFIKQSMGIEIRESCFKDMPQIKERENNIKEFEYLASKVEVEAFLHEEIKTIYFFLKSCR
ncbi:hypothetical protein [Endozoicomonas euniceicola]|uniref:Uncharacterized protein n=1 Tax=Endozoicomonas euniceicola TaxID=1234143 RepID=A0ABY6GRB8_9GAMM|nr:hypothetical protein [Endozoicomonas euniceicola]UYM15299.1 hypothetical protein NX720_20965 [Endozoicomonas euniceicola]